MRIENVVLNMHWGDNRVGGRRKNKASKAESRRCVKAIVRRFIRKTNRLDSKAEANS